MSERHQSQSSVTDISVPLLHAILIHFCTGFIIVFFFPQWHDSRAIANSLFYQYRNAAQWYIYCHVWNGIFLEYTFFCFLCCCSGDQLTLQDTILLQNAFAIPVCGLSFELGFQWLCSMQIDFALLCFNNYFWFEVIYMFLCKLLKATIFTLPILSEYHQCAVWYL